MGALLLFLVPLALLWVLYVRPQQRRMRQLQNVVQALEPGDEVITAGGMYGTVTEVTTDSLFVEVTPGVVVRVVRGAIRERVAAAADEEDDEDLDDVDDELDDGDDEEEEVEVEDLVEDHGPRGVSGNGSAGAGGKSSAGPDPTTPGRREDDA